MAATGSDDEFKVTDRRRRADDDEPSTPSRAAPPPIDAAPAAPSASPPSPVNEASERSLDGLFMMLASSAVVAMGAAADPATGQTRTEPAMAADAIDLLILLRQKTEGNRTPSESQLLDELIYDLQLRYVNAMKRSG